MTVIYATNALGKRSAGAVGSALDLKRVVGTVAVQNKMAPADQFVMCKLPKGALIVGGALQGGVLDSAGAGTACLSLNIGVDKAVTLPDGTSVTALSTSNCLAAAWALGSELTAVAGYKLEATGRNLPLGGLLLSNGPLLCSDDCNAVITIITSAATTYSAAMTLAIDYYPSTVS